MAIATTTTTTGPYYDPYDPALLLDPYPAFRRLREEAPLYYNDVYDFYAVSRFADVEAALVDRDTFSSEKGVILEMIKADIDMPPGTLIHELPPHHTIHRQVLSRVFTPKSMLAIEPDVREVVATRLDELVERESFDWVQDFARYIPMRVFGKLLGIADEDQERMLTHVEAGMSSEMGKPQTYEEANFLTGEFYGEFVDEKIEHPDDGLITRLLTHEFDDAEGVHRTLTRSEALAYMDIIAGAGNHTTNRLITWTGKVLADHPDQRAAVVADRSLVPKVIEETLRYEPSSTQIARLVLRDVEYYGQTVPAGSAFLCLVGSANRDDRVFPDGDRFDIHRDIGHHLAFGYGPHFCLGASLARLEGRVALEEVLERFTDWEIDDDNVVMGTSTGVRGYESLPVSIIR